MVSFFCLRHLRNIENGGIMFEYAKLWDRIILRLVSFLMGVSSTLSVVLINGIPSGKEMLILFILALFYGFIVEFTTKIGRRIYSLS